MTSDGPDEVTEFFFLVVLEKPLRNRQKVNR